jgi:hypothetical protein
MTFTAREVLPVLKQYDVPAEYHHELVNMLGRPVSDRRNVASADRLYRKLGLLFIVVNNHFAHLRLTAALAA